LRSVLVLVAALAAVGLVVAGVAFAAPPDPTTVGADTVSSIALNGTPGTELTVKPGQDVKISANYSDSDPGCPGCINQLEVAFAGEGANVSTGYHTGYMTGGGCIENNGGNGRSGSGTADLGDAPTTPGTYDIYANFDEAYYCGEDWNSSDPGYVLIAQVTVPPTHLKALPQLVELEPGAGIGSQLVEAILTNSTGGPISGVSVSFSAGGHPLCTGTTNGAGVAKCILTPSQQELVNTLDSYTATFAGNSNYAASWSTTPEVVLFASESLVPLVF